MISVGGRLWAGEWEDRVAGEVAEKRNEEGFHNEQTGRNLMRKDKRSAFQLIIRNLSTSVRLSAT